MSLVLKDDIGQTSIWKQLPQRIISLVPSITCSIIELGGANLLAGRTKFCIYPTSFVQDIPIVGGTKQIQLEKILELQPDLVICNLEENTKYIIDSLSANDIPVFVTDIKSLDDNDRLLFQLGKILNQENNSKKIQEEISISLQNVKNIFQNNSVVYLIWKNPYMTVGGDTFIHHILEHIGLVNCYRDQSRYPSLENIDIVEIQPDYLFLSTEPYPFKENHVEQLSQKIPNTKVILVQGEYFSWYGTMMKNSATYFHQLWDSLESNFSSLC